MPIYDFSLFGAMAIAVLIYYYDYDYDYCSYCYDYEMLGWKEKKIKKIRRRWRTGSVVSDAAGRRPVSRGRFSFVSTRFGSFFDLARPSAIVFFLFVSFFFFVPFSVAYISTKNHHRNNKKEEKETEREEKGRNVRRNRNESKKIIRVSFIHYPSTHR